MQNTHELLTLLEGGFSQLKVLVVGDLMLDRYIFGEVDRISPEAPVPVLRCTRQSEHPGGAANVAMNLAGLGCKTLLAGFWGVDSYCNDLKQLLKTAGVDTTGCMPSWVPTILKTRIIGQQQQLLRLDTESQKPHSPMAQELLLNAVVRLVRLVDAVVLSDYAKGTLTADLCSAVITEARAKKIPVLVDPKTSDWSKYFEATVVCPNQNELALATRTLEFDALAGERHRQAFGLEYVCVTRGAQGISLLSQAGACYFPAQKCEVFDVSGAGDTVIATLAACLAGGVKIESAVELANLAAGIVVSKPGTVPITQHDLITALTSSTSLAATEKILTVSALMTRVAQWRIAGETIVFTNGCFDLLHVGHLTLLEECRKFGSKLVLGLNSDTSVRRLKGATHPVVGEQERARIMAALMAVDAVVVFDEDTPLELVRLLRPDVLVKGGDYSVETVIGHEDVLAAGGRVEIVPTLKEFSTGSMICKLAGIYD